MEVLEKVEALLKNAFPPPDKVSLEDDDGIIGTVISDRFVGMPMFDRITIIWDLLGQHLTRDERNRVVLIVASTPEEEIAYSA